MTVRKKHIVIRFQEEPESSDPNMDPESPESLKSSIWRSGLEGTWRDCLILSTREEWFCSGSSWRTEMSSRGDVE